MSTARWDALGTTTAVAVTDSAALPLARTAVERELAAIDAACSRFRDDSELTALNAAAGRWTPVGPVLADALAVAPRAAHLTDGAVDPTVGEALVLAGYDRDFAAGLSEPRRIVGRRVPGWRTLQLDAERGGARVARGTRVDLGATAKALAADRAAHAALRAAGGGVLVNLGGDIAGAPAAGWAIRVTDDHAAGPDAPGQVVTIAAGGLATSSTTVRRWGRDSHHIIDPATGRPARSRWRTVSAAAATCVDANIATTAALVRPDAEAWLAASGLPARLVARDGAVAVLGGWPAERRAAA